MSDEVTISDESFGTLTPAESGDESHISLERLDTSIDVFDVTVIFDFHDDRGLPTLPIKIHEYETDALLDCASELNLINIELLYRLGFQNSDIKRSTVHIKGVTGTIAPVHGEIDLTFILMNRIFTSRFVCVLHAEFPADVLLLYKSMKDFNIVTDWTAGRAWYADDYPSITEICFNTQDSCFLVPCKVKDNSCDIISNHPLVISGGDTTFTIVQHLQ